MLSAGNQRGGRDTATLKVTGEIKQLKRKGKISGKHEEHETKTESDGHKGDEGVRTERERESRDRG